MIIEIDNEQYSIHNKKKIAIRIRISQVKSDANDYRYWASGGGATIEVETLTASTDAEAGIHGGVVDDPAFEGAYQVRSELFDSPLDAVDAAA